MKDTLDFIIIGAQKAGTTSLFEYLRNHPDLQLPDGKEAPFFSHASAYERGWEDYILKTFALTESDARWGTATPQYMVGGLWEQPNPAGENGYDERTVPRRIYEQLPQVRLIAILRDPAERARSHHRMSVMNDIEQRPFAQAIDDLLRPEALAEARREPREITGYVTWGEYGRILTGYLDVFPRDQILVLFTDELEREPERLLRRIYEFLGVRADFMPANVGERYRVGGSDRRFSWLGTNSPLNPWAMQRALTSSKGATRLWHALPQTRRRQIDGLVRRVGYRMDLWNRRSAAAPVDDDEATINRLREHYAPDALRLAEQMGGEPPWAQSSGAGGELTAARSSSPEARTPSH
ncbi:MAG: sulfotransferase [Solirubrobacterales bacterium]|nr:sulfotransferase [Solirubrobacterales bacterium]